MAVVTPLLGGDYPIHPELFRRLYDDWSTLDKFQRTRGVLRLLAKVIHRLWEGQDNGLLIMPASVSMDDHAIKSELTRYLPDVWEPIISQDVDGPNSMPLSIDQEVRHLGRYSACRRVARALYIGTAPGADSDAPGEGTGAAMGWAGGHTMVVDRPEGKAGGMGLGFNGGQLLALAIGGCFCNDLRYAAERLGVGLGRIAVDVAIELEGDPLIVTSAAMDVSVETNDGSEPEIVIKDAEDKSTVSNSLQRGVPVTVRRGA
jgi:organic hydroperoxide reductase OsmC/OhrA